MIKDNFLEALSKVHSLVQFNEKGSKIKNQQQLRELLFDRYLSEYFSDKDFIQYLFLAGSDTESRQTIRYALSKKVDFRQVLWSLCGNKGCDLVQQKLFANLSTDTIWGVLFGAGHVVDSFRLDVDKDLREENWYFRFAENSQVMFSKPYLYHELQRFAKGGYLYNVLSFYLRATSFSPVGGLLSIASFDVARYEKGGDAFWQVIVPYSHISYKEFFLGLADNAEVVNFAVKRLQVYEKFDKEAIRTVFRLVAFMFRCLTVQEGSPLNQVCSCSYKKFYKNDVFKQISFAENNIFEGIYEGCTFKNIDFSKRIIHADFLKCKFINCNFAQADFGTYYDEHTIPILHCDFVGCRNLPKGSNFVDILKCSRIYEYNFGCF